ncbi:MAG: anti-sigma regulatory factor (Ser/Thr protein kinase) [Actinomycetes bacterium]|jgi:anti-sigma regulatory factor (Ser/Thr protein kinase)
MPWLVDMPTATLKIPPATENVRLARLVASAAARRGGVGEDILDELRQAVGEACARAVLRHQDALSSAEVRIELEDQPERFQVRVYDQVQLVDATDTVDAMALALISSLAHESAVEPAGTGTVVQMSWPTGIAE